MCLVYNNQILQVTYRQVRSVIVYMKRENLKPVLKTFQGAPNSVFPSFKEKVSCDLKRLKNRLQHRSLKA